MAAAEDRHGQAEGIVCRDQVQDVEVELFRRGTRDKQNTKP